MQSSLVKLSTLDDGPPYLLCCPPVLQGLDALQTTLATGQKLSPIISDTTEVKCSQNKLLCFQWNAIKKYGGGALYGEGNFSLLILSEVPFVHHPQADAIVSD